MATKYKRILLKLSGEALMGDQDFGISSEVITSYARQIKEIVDLGVEVSIVIGGGNIFRGMSGTDQGIDRVTGDHMGMLATVINSLALQNAIERLGVATRVLSAIEMQKIAEPYIKRRAIRHLESCTGSCCYIVLHFKSIISLISIVFRWNEILVVTTLALCIRSTFTTLQCDIVVFITALVLQSQGFFWVAAVA